jgi:hypothetical protein
MASELRVNTLKDAAGSNEVAMEYVANGVTKAIGFVDAAGSAYKAGNLNISSVTDNGASGKVFAYTANFSAAACCSIGQFNVGHMGNGGSVGAFNYSSGETSGGITLQYYNGSAYTDTAASLLAAGDLA